MPDTDLRNAEGSLRVVLSLDEVADRLGLHRTTVAGAIRRGELPGLRVGRRWLVPVDAFDRLLEAEAPSRVEESQQ